MPSSANFLRGSLSCSILFEVLPSFLLKNANSPGPRKGGLPVSLAARYQHERQRLLSVLLFLSKVSVAPARQAAVSQASDSPLDGCFLLSGPSRRATHLEVGLKATHLHGGLVSPRAGSDRDTARCSDLLVGHA